ncbi:MAG: helical backbone metal receptor [Flavobacteriales bacterium]|nr:helical backbone metal receptor [Flavobacteriales bacterium]MCX7768350.1 helical backbone metal receptor [Flavobacteriales bacterium]MDW8409090.1 helical backbone metal receptor [Flavobacteriales bacterium]
MELRTVRDQMGFAIQVPPRPQRIISLVPSLTEYLHDLGLESRIVGITKFCVHPNHFRKTKTIVGGTKNFKPEIIQALQPDLIVANKEENEKEKLLFLKNQGLPVWISDVKDYDSAIEMMQLLGDVCGTPEAAHALLRDVEKARKWLKTPSDRVPTLYLIWRRPYMTVNHSTFIHHMMALCGMQNVFADHPDRYPTLSEQEIRQAHPTLVVLSSEPYPFNEKHKDEIAKLLPNSAIFLADGEMFSWYGSRMIEAFRYLENVRAQIIAPLFTSLQK